MFTENEVLLNNESYINKDFDSVYRELITLSKKISDRYDPTASNESDPFIVLVKLLAFVTDKINYNIDKNILERFLLSATQEESVQDITSRLGYNMHYYIAAQTVASIKYIGEKDVAPILPKYTVLSTEANNLQYITTADCNFINGRNVYESVPIIECSGSLKTLEVISSTSGTYQTTITINNIDENHRLYFPELRVAQNGIFISGGAAISQAPITENSAKNEWQRIDNLNLALYGSLNYKFGYDSFKQLPYIEFPEWIADIIGSGLTINYIVCNGSAGNVVARSITKISSIPSTININEEENTLSADDFIVTNLSAATNGKNPETIDEAYQGFKKTIGTFDTLVTCRDYANKIYNLLSESTNRNLVSNVQVSDRRDDINYSRNVVEYTENGVQTKTEINVSTSGTPDITANELCLYAFNPVTNLSFENLNKSNGYDNTYNRLKDTRPIIGAISAEKYLCHDFKNFKENDIILIKNLYKLDTVIYTTYKVSNFEAIEILTNINKSLALNFNAREMDFGEEIPLDSLQKVIQSADARIKMVGLNIPEKSIEASLYDGHAKNDKLSRLTSGDKSPDWYNFIVAQNVLSGRAELFDYDEAFIYDFGQTENNTIEDIISISTYPFGVNGSNNKANSKTLSKDESYTLKANEIIQIATPSLKENSKIYPYPVQYKAENMPNSLPKGIYQLTGTEKITFTYTKNNIPQNDTYEAGDILQLNTEWTIKSDPDSISYIPQGTEIGITEINEVKLDKYIKCYWFTNNLNNELKFQKVNSSTNTYVYVLNDNEYFFYTDMQGTYLASCGSGTKLTLTSAQPPSSKDWTIDSSKTQLQLSQLLTDGLEGILGDFIDKQFTTNYYLTLLEQNIITLTENDILTNTADEDLTIPSNYFEDVKDINVSYAFSGNNPTNLNGFNISGYSRSIRALLDINCGPDFPQTLEGAQTVIIESSKDSETTTKTKITGNTLLFNTVQQLSGGEDIDLNVTDYIDYSISPSLYYFTEKLPVITSTSSTLPNFIKRGNHYYVLFGASDNSPTTSNPNGEITLSIPSFTNKKVYIMCYVTGSALSGSDSISISYPASDNSKVTIFNNISVKSSVNNEKTVATLSLPVGEMLILELTNIGQLTFTKNITATNDQSIIVSMPRVVNGINPLLDVHFKTKATTETEETTDNLKEFVDYLIKNFSSQFEKFYAIHYANKDKLIELSDNYKLSSSEAFCDYNNIANKWTLAKIDFENSNIKIAATSLKR